MLVYFGLFMLILTVVGMVMRYESRLVLIVSGLVMGIAALEPMAVLNGMTEGMLRKNMILCICSVMAFAFVMRFTGCDKHLSHAVAKPLRYVRFLLVPGATVVTFLVQIALPSAAGTSAAIGAVVIPLLMSMGVHPAMAGAAVLAGTYGDLLSPGLAHNVYVADIASKALSQHIEAINVIGYHTKAAFISLAVVALAMLAVTLVTGEGKGYVPESEKEGGAKEFKVNYFFALIPILPIACLVIGATIGKDPKGLLDLLSFLPAGMLAGIEGVLKFLAKLKVEHTMLLGAMIGIIATRNNPGQGSKEFFKGLGHGYGEIMGIIIADAVFVGGLKATGLVESAINMMKGASSVATLAAGIGPWALAVVCGSGNAATQAFNEAVTVNAASFGVDIISMGSFATFAGALGRCMSPVAGACFVCAGISGADPMNIVKRTCIPSILGLITIYICHFVLNLH